MSLKRTLTRRMYRANGWRWPKFGVYKRLAALRKQGVRYRWTGIDQWTRK
jgi:hypothetical protein